MSIFKFTVSCIVFAAVVLYGQLHVNAQPKDPNAFNRSVEMQWKRINAPLENAHWILKVNRALPRTYDLPAYTMRVLTREGKKSVHAIRRSDKAQLEINVLATSNSQARDFVASGAISTDPTGRLPQGSPSGKPLGEKSWQSREIQIGSKERLPAYFLQVQDGPTLIQLHFKSHISKDKKGIAQWKSVTHSDRLQMERIARLMLRKLAALKLTKTTFRS